MPRRKVSEEEIELKKNEIKHVSLKILSSTSFHEFTLDEVVRQCTISKGSIYKIYRSKYEVFSALAIDSLDKLHKTFTSSLKDNFTPKERILNLGRVFIDFIEKNEIDRRLILSTKNNEGIYKTESKLKEKIEEVDKSLLSLTITAILECNTNPDTKKAKIDAEKLTIALWALSLGTVTLFCSSDYLKNEKSTLHLREEYLRNYELLLDSYIHE